MNSGRPAGVLHLVPNTLGDAPPADCLAAPVLAVVTRLRYWVAENPKNARQFLKRCGTALPLAEIRIEKLDVNTASDRLPALLEPLLAGEDAGLVSDAGCPAVADPGAALVREAHRLGIGVRPLIGPSSILLALMGSGLGGQRFAFHGYLPVDEKQLADRLRSLEKSARSQAQTQIFIETPYRNARMLRILLTTLEARTLVCTACDLSLPTEQVITRSVADWRRLPAPQLEDRPTVFLLGA